MNPRWVIHRSLPDGSLLPSQRQRQDQLPLTSIERKASGLWAQAPSKQRVISEQVGPYVHKRDLKEEWDLPQQNPLFHITGSSHCFCFLNGSSGLTSIHGYLLGEIHSYMLYGYMLSRVLLAMIPGNIISPIM